jgi:hypothetical protein
MLRSTMSKWQRLLGIRERGAGNLLTAIVGPDNKRGNWEVTWVGDGDGGVEPKDLHAATLTEAVDKAAAAVAELYAGLPPNPVAELQLAIYPWHYHVGDPMYDISVGGNGFDAHDLQDQVPPIEGVTLEDLVTATEYTPGSGIDHCMFRWIRPAESLTRDASTPEPDDSQP